MFAFALCFEFAWFSNLLESVPYLSRGLASNAHLLSLDLSCNMLSNHATSLLAASLQVSRGMFTG